MLSKRFVKSLALLWLSLDVSAALAQSPISIDDLPPPPENLTRLIEAGNVTFAFGGDTTDRSFAAETQYRIAIDFQASTRWRLAPNQRSPNQQRLLIVARLVRLGWQPRHKIWFRNQPTSETFWNHPLVLHELDHVRLSTDPRWKKTLEELKRKPATIQHELSSHEVVSQALVDQVVDQYLQSRMQEVFDLIDIRYRELDQQTAHGRRPLPDDSPLQAYLRPASSARASSDRASSDASDQ